MRWFILCINLTGPRRPRYLVKHYSGCMCEGVLGFFVCFGFLAMLHGLQDLSSPTRNQTHERKRQVLTSRPPGNPPVTAFLDEVNIWICRLSRLPSCMCVGLFQSVEGLNRIKRLSKREHLRLTAFELVHCFFSSFQTGTETSALPGSWDRCHLNWDYIISYVGLQRADCRSWDLSASTRAWADS